MHYISLSIVIFVVYFSSGCSSSTTASDERIDEPSTGQTDVGSVTPDDNGESENNPLVSPSISNPLDGVGTVLRIGSDFGFLEGPVYRPSDNSLYFSDIPKETIFRRQADGTIEVFRENQPTNGLVFDEQNGLLVATHGGRSLTRIDEFGEVAVLADNYEGDLLNSPNDIALHSNGDVYFTDPPYGIDTSTSEVGCAGVYRLTVDGKLSRFWCNGIETRPNGIALSPNQDRLYVSFTLSGQILSWTLNSDGSVGEVGTFAETAGSADGMVVDGAGNLYVASVVGIEVFSSDGVRWGEISIPEQVTNCTLGGPNGKTLFITGKTALYSVELMSIN